MGVKLFYPTNTLLTGIWISLMKYPMAPMMRKPMPTACEILMNSLRSAAGKC